MIISAYLQVAGLGDVGYAFYNPNETINGSRITAGVLDAGDGWYSADATFPGGISSVRWNSTGQPQLVAREYFDVAGAALVWQVLTSTLTLAGSVGKLITDDVDAKISTRSTYAGGDTAGTTTLLSRIASALTITAGKVDVNDRTGFSLVAAYDPAKTAMQAGASVTVGTNNDKSGYSLVAAYDPAKTAMQSGATVALTSAYDAAKTAAAPGAAMTLTTAEKTAIADALLTRNWVSVTGEASASLLNAIRSLRNKWQIDSGGILTVFKEDGSTSAWQMTVISTANAAPITGMQ